VIRVNYWPDAVTAWGRRSWVQAFTPGRVGDLVPPGVDREGLVFLRNGRLVTPDDTYEDHDFVDVAYRPLGPISPGVLIISFLISTAVTFAIRALLPAPQKAKERSDDRSPTHGWNRMQNIRIEGTPIPVVYGEHRVPGTIVNEFVEVDNGKAEATYHALVAVSEGDIYAIADETVETPALEPLRSDSDTVPNGIFLQGNTLANFAGIEAWVRLGTNEQGVVPGFERAKQTFEVDAILDSRTVGVQSTDDLIPLLDFGSDQYEDHWEDFGFAYDTVTEDVDGLEVVLNFPNGLFKIDPASGNVEVSRFVLGIRFAKLDANGNPLLGAGQGGNQDDGWVRLPFNEIILDRQSPFQVSFPVWLYDPTTFIGDVPGDALHVEGWTNEASYFRTGTVLDSAHRPENWPSSTETADRLTFECWVAFDAFSGQGPFDGPDGHVAMMEWSSDGNDNGVWFGFRIEEITSPTGGASRWAWRPKAQVGKWQRLYEWPEVEITPSDQLDSGSNQILVWHHLVWTHKRIDSSTNVTEFYINGVSKGVWIDNADIIVPRGAVGDARIDFGFSNNIRNSDWSVKGWWDEVVVTNTFYNQQRVALRYNGGEGLRGQEGDTNVVVGYRFDGLTGSQGPRSYGGATAQPNTGDLHGTGTLPTYVSDVGKVAVFESPPRLRGKYRVQCVRTNGLPTPGGARHQTIGEWGLAVTWLDEAFSYPNAAYLAIKVPATDQLNTSAPTITQIVKGRRILVWDGVSTVAPSFRREWTKNTAWIAMDIATNTRYGGGQAFKLENVDLTSTKEFADHCDKRVYDGRGRRDFYRQEFETSANLCNSPTSIDAFWSVTSGGPVVTNNTDEAPDGNLTADTIDDQSTFFIAYRGFSITTSSEPDWYSASLFVKKDATATATSAAIRILYGATEVNHVFSIDTGEAVQGCSVEDYNDDWWLVKTDPYFLDKGATAVSFQVHPATYAHGDATTEVPLLQEKIVIWGCSFHRGLNHIVHPGGEDPRCFLYMADEDENGDAQTIPTHWAVGTELSILNANDPAWDTPSGLTKALTITEIRTEDDFDGYNRVWVIIAAWYSDDTSTHPDTSFPNLVENGRNWNLPITDDWTHDSGLTYKSEFDDGVNSGPLTNASPSQSQVLNVEGLVPSTDQTPIAQFLTPPGGGSTRMRARARLFEGVGQQVRLVLEQSGAGLVQQPHVGTDETWEGVQADLDVTSTFSIEWRIDPGTGSTECWVDSIACWLQTDTSGRSAGGQVRGAEALFEYDASHDTFKDLWETLVEVCLTARAMPVREGRRLRFKVEKERGPVGLITMASTIADGDDGASSTFRMKYTSPIERPNYIILDFHDQERNWERSPASRIDPNVDTTSDQGALRSQNSFLQGVTRRSQVLRHADFTLNVHRAITREGSLSAGPGAITYEPGDVVALDHDLVPWGQSGRALHDTATDTINIIDFDFDDFTAWTPSDSGSIQVTPNVIAGPFGEPNADLFESLVNSQVSLQYFQRDVVSGQDYVFSIRVKRKHDEQKFGILMRQSGSGVDLSIWEFEWSTETLTQTLGESGREESVLNEGNGWYRIAVNLQTNNESDIEILLIPERIPAVFSGAAVYLADAQMERGTETPGAYGRPGFNRLFVDRDIVLKAGESYTARVTSASTGASETGTILSPAGTYLRGDGISVSGLGFTPARGDEYIIYTDSERFLAMISAVRLKEDVSMDVEWVQYDASVYDADDLDEDLSSSSNVNVGTPSYFPDSIVVNPVESLAIVETTSNGVGGMPRTRLEVSWKHDAETVHQVSQTRIYVSYLDPDTQAHTSLRHVATASGKGQVASFELPNQEHGREVRVAVQAVGYGGAALSPEDSQSQVKLLSAFSPAPDTPQNFVAHMEGDRIVFDWDHVANHEGVTYEIRLGTAEANGGGWVLAQKIGETRDNTFGPSPLWATGPLKAPDPAYKIRARNRHGAYSGMASLQYSARVANATILSATNYWNQFINERWHTYGDGWKTDSSPPAYDPVLTSLQRHADGYLEFETGKVSGTYVTAGIVSTDVPEFFVREEPLYVEAVVGATCRDPRAVGAGSVNADGTRNKSVAMVEDQIGWPLTGAETAEGDLTSAPGDLPSLRIQMRLLRGTDSSPSYSSDPNSSGDDGWLDYKPGIYQCQGAQFRLVVTRPSDTWDVRIYAFGTRCVRPPDARHYRTPVEDFLAREVFS
jgi:hypothetical protein